MVESVLAWGAGELSMESAVELAERKLAEPKRVLSPFVFANTSRRGASSQASRTAPT